MSSLLLVGCLLAAGGDRGDAAPAATKTQVMVVGMVHLDNPGRDVINFEIKNVPG